MTHAASANTDQITLQGFEPLLQRYLEDGACFEEVTLGGKGRIRLEKVSASTSRFGFGGRIDDQTTIAAYAELFLLLPLLGVPIPGRAEADITARLYVDDQLSKSLQVSERFSYWTTLYTSASDGRRAAEHAKHLTMRALATQVTASLCP
jgi:hypothetical protein